MNGFANATAADKAARVAAENERLARVDYRETHCCYEELGAEPAAVLA